MRYFFVGIGGVSMAALAKLLHYQGHQVAGSDIVTSENTQELQQLGITVYLGHSAKHITDVDYLVINGAITDDNPELLAARQQGCEIIYREELLAQIARAYQQVIAVAGCHGKSSTTAMIGAIFQQASRQPTVHNGVKNNLILGSNQYFITEACEFRKSFLQLKPTMAIITNVDSDHLDCYQDLAEIKTCFAQFAQQADILVKNIEDLNSLDLYGKRQTITYGINSGMVHTKNLRALPGGSFSFGLVLETKIFGSFFTMPTIKLAVVGIHNVYNALAAIAGALVWGIDLTSIQQALAMFKGVARRFELIGRLSQTPVILDYAHHPRELAATLRTADTLYQRYLVVFQPHTYTRTLALWDDFVKVLAQVKHLVLYKTYAARGKVIVGGRALDLSRKLKTKYFAQTTTLTKYLYQNAKQFDAIILCGAGDVVSGAFLIDKLTPM